MRSGDTVLHRPSGEKWSVAYVDGDELVPRGWPLSYAKTADCDLVRACDDATHMLVLRDMAMMSDQSDPRCRYARQALDMV